MNIPTNRLILIGFAGILVLIFILLISGVIPGVKRENPNKPLVIGTLQIWGMGESTESFQNLLSGFPQFKGITFQYRNFDTISDYENSLLEALATGSGPDIFMVRNDALPNYLNKIVPAPQEKLNVYQLSQLFPKVVEKDFAQNGNVYALPISLDTLALYYNRDTFDQHATFAPATWDDLIALIPKFTQYGPGKQILAPAAALGGSANNIERAVDILYLLMAQMDAGKSASQGMPPTLNSENSIQALQFYTQFANAGSAAYTWNTTLPSDLELFSQGRLAMMFNYSTAAARIKEMAPFLDFRVAPVPQIKNAEKKVAFANYFGFAVSRQSQQQALAWDFILRFATTPDDARAYIIQTHRPPALLSLLGENLNDPTVGVYANQAFIADSWITGSPALSNPLVSHMIESVVGGIQTSDQAARDTQGQVDTVMKRLTPQTSP